MQLLSDEDGEEGGRGGGMGTDCLGQPLPLGLLDFFGGMLIDRRSHQ